MALEVTKDENAKNFPLSAEVLALGYRSRCLKRTICLVKYQFANDYCSGAADERRGGFSRPGERRKKRRMRPDFDASAFRP